MYPDRPFPCMCVREIFKAVPYNTVHVQVQYIRMYYYNIILFVHVTTLCELVKMGLLINLFVPMHCTVRYGRIKIDAVQIHVLDSYNLHK